MTHPEHISDITHPEFAKEIRHEMRRILSNPTFFKSTQIAQLLKYLVEGSLAGDGEEFRHHLKEYAIAVEVFGRPVDFTPDADNIVRVEARRLRAKLAQYYSESGIIDPIVITIPAGTYIPTYRRLTESELDLSGRRISHYQLLRRQFVNRWQSTYEAHCVQLQRTVSVMIPTLPALEDENRRKKLFDSLRGGAPEHPNVISVHEVQETGTQLMVVLAAALDNSLGQHVKQRPMARDQVVPFARALVSALASGHKTGLMHGNLSPELVRINPESESDGMLIPQILPFGLSALADLDHPAFDGFRPPEYREDGEADLRSDVWSWGALVCFAVRRLPPSEDELAPALDDLPSELRHVVAKCLDKDPAARYASALEIQEDLIGLAEAPAPLLRAVPRAAPPKNSSRKLVLAGTVLLGLLASVLVFRAFGPRQQRTDKLLSAENPRVVVLPFENPGNDAENAPHSKVIAELIAQKMARLPGVQLVSSRLISTNREKSTEFLTKQLQATYAVDGTLRKSGRDFDATIRLRHLPDGGSLWTEHYQGPWIQLSERAQSLAERAAQTMNVVVRLKERRGAPPPVVNPLAAEAWIKGKFAAIENWNAPSRQSFNDAERRLLEALRLEPEYVDPLVDLGQLYLSAVYPPNGHQSEMLNKAKQLAEKALILDPENPPAQSLMGSVLTDTGRPDLALPYLRRAIDGAPQDPIAYNALSIAYEALGFWESSLAERERSTERDPLLKGISLGGLMLRSRLGRLEEAFAFGDPTPGASHRLAYMHYLRGEPAIAEKLLKQLPPEDVPSRQRDVELLLALAESIQGRPEVAQAAVQKFATTEKTRNERYILLCAIAGDKARLLKEISRHTYRGEYRWVITEPLFRPYRRDPDYQKLVRTLYMKWQKHLASIGPSLPVPPPRLPDPDTYFQQP